VDLAHEADASLNDGLPSNLSSYKVEAVRMHEDKAEGSISKAKESTNGQTKSPGLTFITYSRISFLPKSQAGGLPLLLIHC
jgi:hypothetical protein